MSQANQRRVMAELSGVFTFTVSNVNLKPAYQRRRCEEYKVISTY